MKKVSNELTRYFKKISKLSVPAFFDVDYILFPSPVDFGFPHLYMVKQMGLMF